jgi:hypothetical protein
LRKKEMHKNIRSRFFDSDPENNLKSKIKNRKLVELLAIAFVLMGNCGCRLGAAGEESSADSLLGYRLRTE